MRKWILGIVGAAVVGLLAAFVVGPIFFGPKTESTSTANPSPSVTRDGQTGVVKVVASTSVWGDIVKQLGGDWVDVQVIIDDPLQDPHSYQATARDQLAVNDAELVVINGGGYDDFLSQLVNTADAKDAKFVIYAVDPNDSAGAGDSKSHTHKVANEHVWYDFVSVMEFADKFLATMGEIRPEAFKDLNQNYDFFSSEVANLTLRMEALRDHALGLGVIATEGVGNLLLEHAGFVDQTPEALANAIEEETEVPPAALAEAEALIENKLVSLLVTNAQVQDQVSAKLTTLAESQSIPVVELSELIPEAGMDYLDWMNQVIDQLQEATY